MEKAEPHNKEWLNKRRNDVARLLEFSDKMHRNCIRINVNNSLEHELEKVRQCYILKMNDMEFYTEATFKNGCRADILCLDLAQVIEILYDEIPEECRGKVRFYPKMEDGKELSLVMIDLDARKKDGK